jgi:Family of unknown function (DUF6527)
MSDLRHEFVTTLPEHLAQGVVYVSIEFATAAHLCVCGCGQAVYTPLSPTDWSVVYDGETISLSPSIGNWSLPCRSHYWIRRDRVVWARAWSQERIDKGRTADQQRKARFFKSREKSTDKT